MSSALIEKAWNVRITSAQDKLLLIALADLSDRQGQFNSSYEELSLMTSLSSDSIFASLNSLYSTYKILKIRRVDNPNIVCGALALGGNLHSFQNLEQAAQQQTQRLQQKRPNSNAKLSQSQKKQVAPLSLSDKEKNVHIFEINLENVPSWAEGLMHKHAVLGRQDIWQSFVEEVWATGEKNFTIGHLIKRLTQKIHNFKDLSFAQHGKPVKQEVLKQDAVAEFEEKFSNYLKHWEK